MPRFFVPKKDIHDNRGEITGPEFDHLTKVLRLRPGDRVTLFDDEGWEHEGVLRSSAARSGEIEILDSYRSGRESSLDVTLAQALGKGDKMDWVVEKATELGIAAIIPFVSAHTVPRLGNEKAERRRQRWQKIALSAAMQSGRTRIPRILEVSGFEELAGREWPCDLKLILWEGERLKSLSELKNERGQVRSVLLAVGPEGGFAEEEVSHAVGRGFVTVHLGKRILRTETAAVAAVTLAQFLWGDMG